LPKLTKTKHELLQRLGLTKNIYWIYRVFIIILSLSIMDVSIICNYWQRLRLDKLAFLSEEACWQTSGLDHIMLLNTKTRLTSAFYLKGFRMIA